MSANQNAKQACGCTEEQEMAWCLLWMQDHDAPCEWDQAAGDAYKKAHDKLVGAAS